MNYKNEYGTHIMDSRSKIKLISIYFARLQASAYVDITQKEKKCRYRVSYTWMKPHGEKAH